MKLFFAVIFFINCLYSNYTFSQVNLHLYNSLFKKGDSLYELKEYNDAAINYSKAIRILGNRTSAFHRADAINSWVMANKYDSAFVELVQLLNSESLTFTEVQQIFAGNILDSLISEDRTKPIVDGLFSKAYINFLSQQDYGNKPVTTVNQKQKDLILGLRENSDSAFSHLNDMAYLFLKKKRYSQAYKLFKLSIDHFGPRLPLYLNMMDYYLAINDKDRAYVYFSRAQVTKYRGRAFISAALNIDSVLRSDYRSLSKLLGYQVFPPEYLIKKIGTGYMEAGMTDKAFHFFKMNVDLYPTSYTANRDIGSFLIKNGNNKEADLYNKKSLILQYNLPDNFFHSSFDIEQFFIDRTDSLTGKRGIKPTPPEQFVDDVAKQFLLLKMIDKAERLFKMNVENYPTSYYAYNSISLFYKNVNNPEKSNEFEMRAQDAKEKFGTRRSRVFKDGPIADTLFGVNIRNPICISGCPTIMVDNVHNIGTIASLEHDFKLLFKMFSNDGFNIVNNYGYLTSQSLSQANVLFLPGGEFDKEEIKLLNKWVYEGGSLLTFTHHDWPLFDEVLQSFKIQTSEIEVTHDSLHGLLRDHFIMNPSYIYFSENDSLMGNHVILKGRNPSERVRRVQTFASKSIIGPPGSTVLLKLSESAVDFMSVDIYDRTSRVPVKTPGKRSLGIAFKYGKGKVVVTDSWALMALLFENSERGRMGMNTPGADNKQYALNIIRWLTGYLN